MPRQRRSRLKQPTPGTFHRTKRPRMYLQILARYPGPKQGQAVWSDADKVEGMNLSARRMIIDGDVHYEITGKLRSSTWNDVLQRRTGKPDSPGAAYQYEF